LATGQTTSYSSEQDDGALRKGLPKSYTILTTGAYSSTSNIDLAHLSRTDISFDAATKTITCAGQMGVFKAAGGETIVITGSTSNNGTYTTASATADTVVTVEALADEAAGATVTIAKREAHSNNAVLDNNTGLMWSRYVSDKMGTAGDGKMPWTGQLYDIFAYAAAANTALLAGYGDWRVANFFELVSLANMENSPCVPDTTAFPSFPTDRVLSATTRSNLTTYAMEGDWGNGLFDSRDKNNAHYTILVRAG
jgi:hypothetical protein